MFIRFVSIAGYIIRQQISLSKDRIVSTVFKIAKAPIVEKYSSLLTDIYILQDGKNALMTAVAKNENQSVMSIWTYWDKSSFWELNHTDTVSDIFIMRCHNCSFTKRKQILVLLICFCKFLQFFKNYN